MISSPATPPHSPRSARNAAGRPSPDDSSRPLRGPTGALIVSEPTASSKSSSTINEVLGGISRLDFQMSVAALPHAKLMRAIELLGTEVAPAIRKQLPATAQPA